MSWLVCDYGEVLCISPPAEQLSALVECAGLAENDFGVRYWQHRPGYDRADLTVTDYWAAVLGDMPTQAWLEELVGLDVQSWLHPNLESLAAVERAETRGFRLAVLSNAPFEVAEAIDALPWLAHFEHRFFSCHLHAVKPEPAVYQHVIDALGVGPGRLVFFDDRDDNVTAAAALGIDAHKFTSPRQFDALPAPIGDANGALPGR